MSSSSRARSTDPDKSRASRQVMVAERVAEQQTEKQSDRAADWKKELRQTALESEHHTADGAPITYEHTRTANTPHDSVSPSATSRSPIREGQTWKAHS
jgi:hypothetical protein